VESTDEHHHEEHRDVTSGGHRAAVFGMSDGLVTNISLILGFAGAHPNAALVRLAGLAGLVAGAFSMAAGEYTSMRSQLELSEYELGVERQSLIDHPEVERRELIELYRSKGISDRLATELAGEVMGNIDLALETHSREELGIDPRQLGSPWKAAWLSFVMFAVGAFIPLVPWLVATGTAAIVASIVLGLAASVALGWALAAMTGRSVVRTAGRQVLITTLAASVTYAIGHVVGVRQL
jgi:vacuolar iron transporter family protein